MPAKLRKKIHITKFPMEKVAVRMKSRTRTTPAYTRIHCFGHRQTYHETSSTVLAFQGFKEEVKRLVCIAILVE